MVVNLFRNLTDFKWLIAVVLLVALFLPFKTEPVSTGYVVSLLPDGFILSSLQTGNVVVSGIIPVAVMILLAVLFNFILITHKLLPVRNFPGLFYTVVLLSVWLPVLPVVTEIIPVYLIILSVMPVFTSEGSSRPLLRVFDASFMISIACLFSLYFIPFLLIPFVALVLFRQGSLKLWVSAFSGMVIPHVFLISGLFVFSGNVDYFKKFAEFFGSLQVSAIHFTSFPYHWFIFGPVLIITLFRTMTFLGEKKIIVRKKMILLVWFLVIPMLLLFFRDAPFGNIMLLISIIFGFFITVSMRFLQEKRIFILLTDLSVPALILSRFFL